MIIAFNNCNYIECRLAFASKLTHWTIVCCSTVLLLHGNIYIKTVRNSDIRFVWTNVGRVHLFQLPFANWMRYTINELCHYHHSFRLQANDAHAINLNSKLQIIDLMCNQCWIRISQSFLRLLWNIENDNYMLKYRNILFNCVWL